MATRKRTQAVRNAQNRYDKLATKRVAVKLNIKTDADILAHLETIDNKQGYIKELIRADMARRGGAAAE